MSNSLDPDQTRRLVGSDLGPNCLQRLSADDTSRHIVKDGFAVNCLLSVSTRPQESAKACNLFSDTIFYRKLSECMAAIGSTS